MCRHGWGTTTMGRDGDCVRRRETIDSESIVGEMTTALERDGALGRPWRTMGRDGNCVRRRETIDSESIVGETTMALGRDGALGRPAHAGRDKHLIFSV